MCNQSDEVLSLHHFSSSAEEGGDPRTDHFDSWRRPRSEKNLPNNKGKLYGVIITKYDTHKRGGPSQ